MRKILVYTENYERGGGNQYIVDLINYFPDNCSFILISNQGGLFNEDLEKISRDYKYEQIDIKSIPILYAKLKLSTKNRLLGFFSKALIFAFKFFIYALYKRQNSEKILSKLRHHKPDLIVSCSGGYPGAITCLDCVNGAVSQGIPVWLTVVSMPQKTSLIDSFYRDIDKKVTYLIVNAENIKNAFTGSRNFQDQKIVVLHNFINSASITTEPVLFKEYNTNLPLYKLGYVGRIEHAKGIFFLLDAFKQLLSVYPNLQLVLTGSGRDLELAQKHCSLNNITDKVEFMGYYRGNVSEVLKTFDLFIFPSLWEGLPYSILEAMANGILVISTNVGGIPEIITDNYNGFLVAPANAEELHNKITYVLNNSQNNKIIENAVETIKTKFSETLFNHKLNLLLSDTLKNN